MLIPYHEWKKLYPNASSKLDNLEKDWFNPNEFNAHAALIVYCNYPGWLIDIPKTDNNRGYISELNIDLLFNNFLEFMYAS